MNGKIKYTFLGNTWQHTSPGGWHFVSFPKELAKEIRETFKPEEEGWGRLKAIAKIGNSDWKTAIWFDAKKKTYLLPIKAEIRKSERLKVGENVKVIVWI